MSFLQLKDIGKIYVSEGNVSVGIRNVNLSFEKGEFVAITGASGSGKSTLLNVISGMDTYEEGELFIEGNPTSHYVQSDWEEYREKYISFIFQDYNIIESFTVLQNVELALMSINNPIERRQRALELLKRVGLSKHLKQKGSQLSGGQKQRCVIARALAKESPIILADEPTGNLDAESSKEIIALLREVSADKLLIVVTHDFEEVEAYATRHVRVYDGAIEANQLINEQNESTSIMDVEETENVKKTKSKNLIDLRNGYHLGTATFFSKPKLTIFICFILLIGTLGATLISGALGDIFLLFKPYRMFQYEKGRVIVSHRVAKEFSTEEINSLVENYGAEYGVHYDAIYDVKSIVEYDVEYHHQRLGKSKYIDETLYFLASDKNFGKPDLGHYPEDNDEVLLYVPYAYQQYFGKDEILVHSMHAVTTNFDVVGIKYYYDNTKQPIMVLTENAYETVGFRVSKNWRDYKSNSNGDSPFLSVIETVNNFMNPDDHIYNQMSLFFKNDRAAKKAAEKIMKEGYIACTSKENYSPSIIDVVERFMTGGFTFIIWFLAVLFLSFFVNMCTHRSLDVLKNDLAILRSMGISVRVIKISMYVRMYISMIPGILLTAIGCAVIFLNPDLNGMLNFIHIGQYLFIFLGIFLITTRVTRKQIKRLFDASVKKTLKGGAEA